jgi:serine/threonine protein kinase
MAESAPGPSDSLPDATLIPSSATRPGDSPDQTQARSPESDSRTARQLRTDAGDEDTGVTGYELLEELGRGGMGVVYRAKQRALNRLVALKMVLAGAHAQIRDLVRFRSEAEVVAQLQHPNIVQIFEIGEQNGRPYLALELVTGGTLQKKIAGTPQPTRASAHLVELLARAIHFAHLRGVVHRDLKPGNVLLAVPLDAGSSIIDPDGAQVAALYGVPKVTDFGLAKRLEDDNQQTQSGDILGTPSYMAPEQAGGQSFAAGPATDVYALGAILYELLTGRPPFKGSTTFETIQQVRNEDPVAPSRLRPRLPKDLERICLKCLAKDPRRRYASALELAADLRRHLNGESVYARSAPPVERLLRWARRNPVPTGLLLAVVFGAGLGFWHLSELSRALVRTTALEGAVQQAETINEVNRYYGRVAAHLQRAGVQGDSNWESMPGERTMPPPATLTIDLGQQISARSESGMQVRLYSDYPFKNRLSRPPPDEFEREALQQLRSDPKQPYYRFEELDGRPVLRYATARVMEPACVNCHNTHPDRNTSGPLWKTGDVRGVQEIIRPLDRDQERIHRGLRSTMLIVGGSGLTLLGLTVFLIYLGNRRHRLAQARHAYTENSAIPPGAGTKQNHPKDEPPSAVALAPSGTVATAVSGATVPEEPVVVWRLDYSIGTLTPVRIVAPGAGTLRLYLSEGASQVELRVEIDGEAVTSGLEYSPRVDVTVRTGSVVVARLRAPEVPDAHYSLSAELLVVRGHDSGATDTGSR